MVSESAARALAILRDGSRWQWSVIPLLALVLYVYAKEIERRNWSVVFAALAVATQDERDQLLLGRHTGSEPTSLARIV
jgi:vacuolar-type H+-ATPase subunit C/Vma6